VRFLAPERNYAGCPFSSTDFLAVARAGRGSPDPRRCRPQGSCPSRRFQLARGSHEVFWTPPFAVAPDASRTAPPDGGHPPTGQPFPARALGAPLQSFPFPGSRTRSRGPLLPCGFALRPPPAQRLQDLHDRFHPSRQPFATRARPKADPGLMSRDVGSPRSLVRSPRHTGVCRTYRPHPTYAGLAGKRPARPLRSFAPPGSPFRDDLVTWPGRGRPSVLSWGSCPPELSPPRFRVRSLASVPGELSPSRAPPGAQPSRLHTATRTPMPELASPGSVDARTL